MAHLVRHLKSLLKHQIARNASWMLLGQVANFIIQAGCFILLARLLGVTQYGIFAGAIALVGIITPYSSLGSSVIFMRYVTADRSKAGVYWGNILLVTAVVSVFVVCIYFYLGPALTNIHNPAIFAVLVFGNCFLDQITLSGSRVFQTFEMLHYSALMSFLSMLARLLTVSVMWITWHHATALQWAIATLVPSCLAALISIILVKRQIGSISFAPKMARHHLREGLGFSFSGSATSIYNDVDKTILSHYGLNRENGFYTLAYRIIEIATAPLNAVDYALLPRFFQLGRNGMRDAFRLSVKSMRMASLLGVGIAGFLLLVSPIIPNLVGRDFSGTITALRWLCWIPLLRGIHRLAGGALTGTGYQHLRNVGQIAVAVINIMLNLLWIPAFGWIGAAWSSVASDGLLALITVLLLWWVAFHHTCTSDVKETAS